MLAFGSYFASTFANFMSKLKFKFQYLTSILHIQSHICLLLPMNKAIKQAFR